MMRALAFSLLALTLTACGVQRPLMRPIEIPAYEEQQRKKRENIIEEKRMLDAIDAKEKADAASKSPTPSLPAKDAH